MFSTRNWRLLALFASIALVNALVLPALALTEDHTINILATNDTASEEALAPGVLTLTRTGEVDHALDIGYTVGGTGTAGDDYVALTGIATFAIGEDTVEVTVTPIEDTEVEGDETVILTLDTAGYTLGDSIEATVTIVDNDGATLPTIEVVASDATATEEGLTTGSYTFTRTGDLTDGLTVDYTVTGTATTGDDYVALTGTAVFAVDAATVVVGVTPVDDAIVEGDETVIITLDANASYILGVDDQATVTIEDNDTPAVVPSTVAVTATDDTATEEGPTSGVFTLTRTGDLTATLTVDYTVTGTATTGDDYVALTGTATFAVDAATASVVLTPVDDTDVEDNETVILTVDANAAYILGDASLATVTIVDNDEAVVDEDEEDDTDVEQPVAALPSDKSDCKKGGWEELGVFKNQGDCVSFVATGGKNPPANPGDTDDDALDG